MAIAPEQLQTVDYIAPTAIPRRQVFSVMAFLVVGIPIVCLLLVMIFVIPKFEAIFADFGTRLPAITQFLIDVARICARFGWLPAALFPLAAGFVFPLFVQPDLRHAHARVLIALLLVLVMLLATLLILIIALFMPMLSLIQNISGK